MKASNTNNGFKTPENYFDGFTDKLLSKITEEQSALPKGDGFITPEGYFDGLHENILRNLNLEKEETKVIKLNPYRKYYFAAAAVAAMAIVLFGLNFNKSVEPTFESLAHSEIEDYFEDNKFDLDDYEIAEVFPVHELEINDILINRFEEENMLDYLNDNIEDFETFNLEDNE